VGMKTPARSALPSWLSKMRGGSARTELTVSDFLPIDYPAFCRVFNPARAAGVSRSWTELAGTATPITGRTQWRDVASQPGASDLPRLYPIMGGMDTEVAAALASVLGEHTHDPDSVYFLAWEGYADLNDAYRDSDTSLGSDGRQMHVLHGSLADVGPSVTTREADMPLWWIAGDGSWAVGNDIYARSVYVGGSAECIDDVLQKPLLEGVRVAASEHVVAEDY
jgi:hypothetical protein